MEDVEKLVLLACKETALSFRGSVADRSTRTMILSLLRSEKESLIERLKKILEADIKLAMCRFDSAGTGVPDGFTPLHVVASTGNLVVLKILLSYALSPTSVVNTWVRDLQGRTPLHVAVANGKLEVCKLLREAMKLQHPRSVPGLVEVDPVGADAPIDLTGSTPLGWAAKENDGRFLPLFLPMLSIEDPVVGVTTTPVKAPEKPANSEDMQLTRTVSIMRTPPPKAIPSASILHTPITISKSHFLFQEGDKTFQSVSPLPMRQGMSPMRPTITSIAAVDPLNDTPSCDVLFGFSEVAGWRPYMEDRVIIDCPLGSALAVNMDEFPCDVSDNVDLNRIGKYALFGVCDGHGGDFTARYVQAVLPLVIRFALSVSDKELDLNEVLTNAFIEVDTALSKVGRMSPQETVNKGATFLDKSGSTAVVCLVSAANIYVANVGDSRAVLVKYGSNQKIEAFALSNDHKGSLPEELKRIEDAGLKVVMIRETIAEVRIGNEEGGLRMSRAFGDFRYKAGSSSPKLAAVTAAPEVICHNRSADDGFVVVACDGVWDVMSNDEVAGFIVDQFNNLCPTCCLFTKPGSSLGKEYVCRCKSDCAENLSDMFAGALHVGTPVARDKSAGSSVASAQPIVLPVICDALVRQCIDLGSQDNITVVIVMLQSLRTILQRTIN